MSESHEIEQIAIELAWVNTPDHLRHMGKESAWMVGAEDYRLGRRHEARAILPLIRAAEERGAAWQDISTAPLETKIQVRMASGWVATAILHEETDHWTTGASIVHYNGNVLVNGFRGPLTGWKPLPPIKEGPEA